MSHFSKVARAQVRNPEAFVEAARELGFDGRLTRDTTIKDYAGKQLAVDLAIKVGDKYDIALSKNESGRYDIVGDFWGVRQYLPQRMKDLGATSEEGVQDALLRTTTKHDLVAHYRRQGFIARVSEDAQHNIQVELTR